MFFRQILVFKNYTCELINPNKLFSYFMRFIDINKKINLEINFISFSFLEKRMNSNLK